MTVSSDQLILARIVHYAVAEGAVVLAVPLQVPCAQ